MGHPDISDSPYSIACFFYRRPTGHYPSDPKRAFRGNFRITCTHTTSFWRLLAKAIWAANKTGMAGKTLDFSQDSVIISACAR
jgi:hypothetical protein